MMDKIIFKPCDDGHGGTLIDIWMNGGWCGSRRTLSQCERFLEKKEETVIDESLPLHDTHIRMQQCFKTFGAKWWYLIFKEIQKREGNEESKGKGNARIH